MMLTDYEKTLSSSTIDPQEKVLTSNMRFSVWKTFKRHIPRFLATIIIDIILPLFIYLVLQKYVDPVFALLAASSPPLIMVIIKAVCLWTFDALGFLVFFTFFVSAIVAVLTRNSIVLLLEKSLMTGVLSMFFGLTLIPCQRFTRRYTLRPLAYYFYQDLVQTTAADVGLPNQWFEQDQRYTLDRYTQLDEDIIEQSSSEKQDVAQLYRWLFENCPSFRISCYSITIIWSIGFFLEFLARIILISFCKSVNQIFIYGHIILSTITALLIAVTIFCITIERKYTLAFIARWKQTHTHIERTQQPPSSDLSASAAILNLTSNSMLHVNV
jgi:hypothetical protein